MIENFALNSVRLHTHLTNSHFSIPRVRTSLKLLSLATRKFNKHTLNKLLLIITLYSIRRWRRNKNRKSLSALEGIPKLIIKSTLHCHFESKLFAELSWECWTAIWLFPETMNSTIIAIVILINNWDYVKGFHFIIFSLSCQDRSVKW